MRTYHLALRHNEGPRVDAFRLGLHRIGLTVAPADACDVFVTWNRIGFADQLAGHCKMRGGSVLVVENAAWGNDFAGESWLTMARDRHNTAGMFPVGGPERWDALGVDLAPWRESGGEVVGLPQRGIGSPPTAQPRGWNPPGCARIRQHPGKRDAIPLGHDLRKASKVVTWGSGAAIKALMWGIRVESHMPQWVGEQNNTDAGRLDMFRRLAWAQWRLSEIENGEAFAWLLKNGSVGKSRLSGS